ncbi:phytanoyl-CoA dioxygenase domain-containing protein 1 [Trichonephila clavipes]|nr:phytanoyl-CoA dioxygenase domain-containing protein 1 [Trichonephila clavipes]
MVYEDIYQEFSKNGFALIQNFFPMSEVEKLLQECNSIVQNMTLPEHLSVFHTGKDQARDEYFMTSGDKISFFFEKEAVNNEGELVVNKNKALNKMGHALHWLNPTFKSVTFSRKVKDVLKSLQYEDPAIVQSMVIFKHPEIGGEVTPHQDSTFLYTEPLSAVGLWIPLVDITLKNGCLWFIPGSHKDEIYQRYVKNPNGSPQLVLEGEVPKFDDNLYVPVLPKKGDCVVIHGSVIHKSGKNTSDKSRPIYTFHVVEQKDTEYSKKNWLQPSEVLPFPSLYSN